MTALPKAKMTVDEFLAWALDRPGRYELVDGEVVAMAPEQVRHARTKGLSYIALADAVRRAGVGCEVFPDGMTVRVDPRTAYEPDALVRCGAPLPDEAIEVPDPLIVVEVLSPSTSRHDTGTKLSGYFQIASVQHYLIIDPVRNRVIHHRRGIEIIETRIAGEGLLRLEPPGIELAVEALFTED
jgi:Uma2 family endonuclease